VVDDILAETEEGMKKAIDAFKRDLSKVRTGRANLALLDDVKIEYYGSLTPLNQVATLNVVDARLITVKPWEKNLIPVIEKAVRAASLGINPVADADLVRLPVPPLTQERRKELAKQVGKMAENARVAVRAARRDGNEMLKDAEKEKEISEDEGKRGQKGIQELTDKYVAQVEDIAANKEKEILEI
jgi:ribosome recycling factor